MINMLKVLMIKVDNMQEQIGGNPEMEIPRKNQEEMLEIKNTKIEMKNAFNGLITRLDTTEERISEHENMLTEISKTKAKRKKLEKSWNRISKNCGITTKGIMYQKRERNRKNIFEAIITENFPKLMPDTKPWI